MIDLGLNLQSLFGINPGANDFYQDSIPYGVGYGIGADDR
jgi:hypothetical protein